MIKFNHVYKIFERDIKALDDITFTVEKGELVFLTGPSGAGKSTIFNLLYRDEHPDMGTILVENTDIAHLNASKVPFYRRKIGFVFQDFKLLFDRSIFDNIALPLVITGSPKEYIKRTVDMAIKNIGLEGRESLNPWHLSGGEKQKVALARALVLNPPLLMADEPTGNLDEESAWNIMETFVNLNKNGITVLIASHNKEMIKRVGRRVIRLEKGRIVSDALV
ncbi:MAG: cell division ATP-binding protein FtsE [Spirochaetia bacterium]|nr:cell division ATP-binding protein FtsE [Spirochaetia bacterium]